MNWQGVGKLLIVTRDHVARGWCNRGPAKSASGSVVLDPTSLAAVAWSPIGGLMVAAQKYRQPWERVTDEGSALSGAVDCIREAAGLSNRGAPLKLVADWNDALEDTADGTAAEQCLRILNRAVEPFEADAHLARAAGDR